MWSRPAYAREPSSVTTRPFTVTRPSRIIVSASRRDANPACAIIFCSRSGCITLAVRRCPILLHSSVILSAAKDLRLRILRFFAVFAAQNDGGARCGIELRERFGFGALGLLRADLLHFGG